MKVVLRHATSRWIVLFGLAAVVVLFRVSAAAQGSRRADDQSLTYLSGQAVVPVFHGWMENPDGTADLFFSYINRNWEEEIDIPVGMDNNLSPAPFGPDGGQPTHFYPRQNRWMFAVRVPKDFGNKEVVWTLTAHGQTNRAYGTLKPGYIISDFLMQHEFGGQAIEGRKKPVLKIDGEKQWMVKVGQQVELSAVATDEPLPGRRGGGGAGAGGAGRGATGATEIGPGQVGGDFVRATARGLWFVWSVYRGPAKDVKFDPSMPFKVWEDERGGSPWSPEFKVPPIPPGNKWVYHVTFKAPGTYVLRALAHNGGTFTAELVTFNVTP